jgi:hypothetical protein
VVSKDDESKLHRQQQQPPSHPISTAGAEALAAGLLPCPLRAAAGAVAHSLLAAVASEGRRARSARAGDQDPHVHAGRRQLQPPRHSMAVGGEAVDPSGAPGLPGPAREEMPASPWAAAAALPGQAMGSGQVPARA